MQSRWALRKLGYKVLGSIGEGGYGKVKLATSKKHPDKVAIKIMDGKSNLRDFATKFLPRELTILRCVKHPHIIEVYEIYEMPNKKVFIVMEAAAMNLYQKVESLGHMPTDQARTVFSQLVSAVSYLHQQDIVHRDLKCPNVLLTADGQVKLADFGLGCFTPGCPDLRKTFDGTPAYAPPELLMHEPYDGKKSDVWSLGIILYFMVTGRLPFIKKGFSLVSLLRLQCGGVRFPPEIPVEEPCRELIASMLCFSPKKRPSITDIQQDPWLQSMPEQETSGTADLSGLEAERPPDQNVLETAGEYSKGKSEDQEQQQQHSVEDDLRAEDLEQRNLPKSSGLLSSTMKALEQDDVQTSEKSSPVKDSPAKTDDEDEQKCSASSPDVSALQAVEEVPQSSSSVRNGVGVLTTKSFRCESELETVGSNNGASRTKKAVSVVRVEESGCLGCSLLCTAVKRAAKKYVAAPILKTAQSLRRKIRKILRINCKVEN